MTPSDVVAAVVISFLLAFCAGVLALWCINAWLEKISTNIGNLYYRSINLETLAKTFDQWVYILKENHKLKLDERARKNAQQGK